MKDFVALYKSLEEETKPQARVEAIVHYFNSCSDKDKIWALSLLTHKKLRRVLTTQALKEMAIDQSELSTWLIQECFDVVKDQCETIALLLPLSGNEIEHSLAYWLLFISELRQKPKIDWSLNITEAWNKMYLDERYVFNKMVTGSFKSKVIKSELILAVAQLFNIEPQIVSLRLAGDWSPEGVSFIDLFSAHNDIDLLAKPYAFHLASTLDEPIDQLGITDNWIAEWKWEGLRTQLIYRDSQYFLWSKQGELLNNLVTELDFLLDYKGPNFVLDAQLVVMEEGQIKDRIQLNKRLNRSVISKKTLVELPLVLIVYDILELESKDIRSKPFQERRLLLESFFEDFTNTTAICLSPLLKFEDWNDLIKYKAKAREEKATGLMIKSMDGNYLDKRGPSWRKWHIDPLTLHAVLIYAQRNSGPGNRSFNQFSFAVWKSDELVPIVKLGMELDKEEMDEILLFIKTNKIERFGPVTSIKASLIFEIGFDSVHLSNRHKSGITLSNSMIASWRKDLELKDITKLKDLKKLV